MTNEQHIENLKKLKSFHNGSYGADIDRAIKALEQESCDDAISRQALLDAFGFSEKTRKWGGDHSGYDTMMLYEIQDMIESAPSVKPQEPKTGHWIPVSERLPDKATRVLTSWVYVPTGAKYIEVAERYGDDDDYTFYGDTDEYKMNRKDHKVIAWMPLPEPYKAESEG